jgi:hypothetical protein
LSSFFAFSSFAFSSAAFAFSSVADLSAPGFPLLSVLVSVSCFSSVVRVLFLLRFDRAREVPSLDPRSFLLPPHGQWR